MPMVSELFGMEKSDTPWGSVGFSVYLTFYLLDNDGKLGPCIGTSHGHLPVMGKKARLIKMVREGIHPPLHLNYKNMMGA